MTGATTTFCSFIAAILLVVVVIGKPITSDHVVQDDEQQELLQQQRGNRPDMALIEDDGSLDTALINYLFARQMVRRLQTGDNVIDLQRKRSHWKQCAFNAVSCFGRRRRRK